VAARSLLTSTSGEYSGAWWAEGSGLRPVLSYVYFLRISTMLANSVCTVLKTNKPEKKTNVSA